MDFHAKKSVVLITGATGPLGSAYAREFASILSEESHLLLTSRSEERLKELKRQLAELNPAIHIAGLQWDLANVRSEQLTEDLLTATNTVRHYAGLNIRLRSSRFVNAVMIHNAAEIGDANQDVLDIGRDAEKLQDVLNVNVVAPFALTTAFASAFDQAVRKVIVNSTAPCAENAYPSFGYNSISKAARKIGFDVLATERPDFKVLHFNPVAVDTPTFRNIRDRSHNEQVRSSFRSMSNNGKLYAAEHVAAVLGRHSSSLFEVAEALAAVLQDGSFESGAVVGTNDVPVLNFGGGEAATVHTP